MKDRFSQNKYRIFASYIRPHGKAFAADMILSLAIALIDLIFSLVSRKAMQELLPEQLYRAFFVVMCVLLAAYLLRAYFQYLVTVVGHRM